MKQNVPRDDKPLPTGGASHRLAGGRDGGHALLICLTVAAAAVLAGATALVPPSPRLGDFALAALAALFVATVAAAAFAAGRRAVTVRRPQPPALPTVAVGPGADGNDLVVARGLDGRILSANDVIARRLGRPSGAFDGLVFADFAVDLRAGALFSPDDLAGAARRRVDPWRVLRRRLTSMAERHPPTPTPVTGLWGDMRLETVDGPRWYSWREEAIAEGGVVTGMLSVGRDVTDRKAIEAALEEARDQAQAANEAKSRFLAMVSHEIRTPLNGILGMTGLMMRTQLTPEQRTYARAVETSGEALMTLIGDLLDFSKIEAGRLELEPGAVALVPLVEELVELLAPRAQAKGIELAAYVDPRLPERLIADPARLRQVLFNLAGNGIKFTSEGGVAIEVQTAPGGGVAGRAAVHFQVRDTGIGIAYADQERIFGEFEQADPGPARAFGGSGLGLAIARQLVRLMGGDIALDSAPGAGACFTFALDLPIDGAASPSTPATAGETPAPPVEAGEIGARAALARLAASFDRAGRDGPLEVAPLPQADLVPADRELAGRRVLVVSPALIEGPMVLRRLFDAGADVTLAGTREIEADLATGWRPDAVLVDAAAGDPLALADRIRAVADVPMGVLMAPTERPMLALWQAAGYAVYLVKPIRARTLIAGVRTLVGEAGLAAGAPPDTEPSRPSSRSLDVLLCDDNEINLLLGRSLMEKLGHRVVVAASGREAVDRLTSALDADDGFDVVLMDLHMPEVDGAEAARRIRRALDARPGSRRPHLIALTADALAETRNHAEPGLFDDWLAKPLRPDDLEASLARVAAWAHAS